MKKSLLYMLIGVTSIIAVLASCGGEKENKVEEVAYQNTETEMGNVSQTINYDQFIEEENVMSDGRYAQGRSIVEREVEVDTTSQYQSSYRKAVSEDMEVIFLGMPRIIKVPNAVESEWVSSDEQVATVKEGIVTGWHEGIVTITQREGNQDLEQWQFAVTTFNDGRMVEASFELGREEIQKLLVDECGVHEPAFWQTHINTIQDVFTYFQESGFMPNYDLPILCTVDSEWLWSIPGDMIMIENSGASSDLSDAACYLLQHDFEDQGFILVFGNDSQVMNWFYEDGCYYLVSFKQLIRDIRDGKREEKYTPFKASTLEEFTDQVLSQVKLEETLTILMTSSQGHDFQPPVYLSYLHDTSEIYYKHAVIGLEDAVLSGTNTLYNNSNFDYEIIAVPTEEIPKGLPRYGEPSRNFYEYD